MIGAAAFLSTPLGVLGYWMWWLTIVGFISLLLVWAWSATAGWFEKRSIRRKREEAKERHIEARRMQLLYPSRGLRRRDRRRGPRL